MPADHEPDPLDRWLNQQVRPLPPPPGTFELITRRARRRKIRKVALSAVSAAAVAAAVAVGVPLGLTLNLNPSTRAGLAAGSPAGATSGAQSGAGQGEGTGSAAANPARSAASPAAGGAAGYLPPGFRPTSVTWDSLSDGWVIGPAGTPGQCANANPYICTSVARTDDGGLTWHGLPAPDAGSPDGASGVSGIRFLDGRNGWAFGPELWVTHDAGKTWTAIGTGGQRVTDLETAGDRAYALFARCGASSTGRSASFASGCTSYTLMTATAGSDQWAPAGRATTGLGSPQAAGPGMIALYGATGYLAAPDGALYSGPLGGTWRKAGVLPCPPRAALADGLPGQAQLALLSPTGLATYCTGGAAGADTGAPRVYQSADSGATWTAAGQWPPGAAAAPASIAATSAGTLLLATGDGIWLLRGQTWEKAVVRGTSEPDGGFSYVGMTSAAQGVALPADTSLHEVYMTTDGGATWQARPIKSS